MVCPAFHFIAHTPTRSHKHTNTQMPVVAVSTLGGGGDIVIPFPDNIPITAGDLVRELATRVPNHRSTFLLCVNDAESPVEGHAEDADLATVVVDTTRDVTLLFETYEAFATGAELKAAVGEWLAGGERKTAVSKRYGHRIGAWDVSNVTDMCKMFSDTEFNDDLSGWDVSNVTDMRDMFFRASAFSGDVSGWDTSSVTDMGFMFHNAHEFAGDVSGWNTSSVTNMCVMFGGSWAFDSDVSGWDTSSVTDMGSMFEQAHAFNSDVSGWDTSNVTNMCCMFNGATAFAGDVSGWDTSSVTTMRAMFDGAAAFTGDVSGWDVSNPPLV
jgi:surface protein